MMTVQAMLQAAVALAAFAVPPAAQPARPVPRLAILGGKVLTVTRGTLEGAAVLLSGGRIDRIVADPPAAFRPDDHEVIDAAGLWVLPGFVDLHSHIGGSDINDMVYPVNPGFRVLDNVVPGNPLLQKAQAGGVTTVLFIPGSGTNMSGFGAIIKTGGDSIDDMLVRFPGALKIAQGGNPERRGGDLGRDRMGMNWLIRNVLEEGRRYTEAWDAFEAGKTVQRPELNPRLEYFRGLFHREYPVVVHTQGYQLVLATIRILHDEMKLRVVIDHGEFDGSELGPEAAARGIMVMNGPRQFRFDNERGAIVGTARRWFDGGIKDVGINTDAPVVPQEELTYQCAMAIRYGLDPEVALRGITIQGARALGIEKRIGSLEEGKDADLVLWTGDPFDVRSHVVVTIINGRVVYDARREPRRF
jgi:imidazolonepropionase-like amidohydrolase